MEDGQIIDLYWSREEAAIEKTQEKYARYCHYISFHILRNEEDAREWVNDAFMRVWNAIPPKRPENLKAFLDKIVRNLSLNRYEKMRAQKRGNGVSGEVFEELEECLLTGTHGEDIADDLAIIEILNSFLSCLKINDRRIFMKRYWYFSTIGEIASELGYTQSKVKMSLKRSRERLKRILEEEDIWI